MALDAMTVRVVKEMTKSEVVPAPLEAFIERCERLLANASPEKSLLQADIALAIATFELSQGQETPELTLGDRSESQVESIRKTFMPGRPLPDDLCVEEDTPVIAKFRKRWSDGTFFGNHGEREVKIAFPNDRQQFRIVQIDEVRLLDNALVPETPGKKK